MPVAVLKCPGIEDKPTSRFSRIETAVPRIYTLGPRQRKRGRCRLTSLDAPVVSSLFRHSLAIAMKFMLVDRVVELQPGESIKTVKNLSIAEEYLQDHFPGFPVMPGVLMVESLVQAGAWLMRADHDFKYSCVLLKEAKAVKFNSFVSPGKSLHVECKVHKKSDNEYTFKAAGLLDGKESAVSARITLEQFNLADRNPEMESSDERRRKYFRDQWGMVWMPPSA